MKPSQQFNSKSFSIFYHDCIENPFQSASNIGDSCNHILPSSQMTYGFDWYVRTITYTFLSFPWGTESMQCAIYDSKKRFISIYY